MPIEIYNKVVSPAVPKIPGGPRLQDASLIAAVGRKNAPDLGLDEFLTGALRLGRQQLNLVRARDITEATTDFQRRLSEFKTSYMETNKGKDALNAGADFEAYATSLVEEMKNNDSYDYATHAYLSRATAPMAISFIETGNTYQRQQSDIYDKTLQDGAIASLNQFVAENAGNDALIQDQVALTKDQLQGMNPGMDMTAAFAKIDQSVAGNRIGAYLARNDIGSARSLFNRDIAQLGDKADEYAARIRNAEIQAINRSLAQEQRAEIAARRRAEAAKNEVGRQIVDLRRAGKFDEASALLDENKSFFGYSDYNTLRDTLSPEYTGAKDNLSSINEIIRMQTAGEDFVSYAESEYLAGRLTKSTYEDYTKDPFTSADTDAITMINSATGGENPDPIKGVTRARMVQDYRKWAKENPKATPMERLQYSNSLITQYSLIDTENNLATVELPKGFSRTDVMRATDLSKVDSASKELIQAYKSGKISKAEFEAEGSKLVAVKKLIVRKMSPVEKEGK